MMVRARWVKKEAEHAPRGSVGRSVRVRARPRALSRRISSTRPSKFGPLRIVPEKWPTLRDDLAKRTQSPVSASLQRHPTQPPSFKSAWYAADFLADRALAPSAPDTPLRLASRTFALNSIHPHPLRLQGTD